MAKKSKVLAEQPVLLEGQDAINLWIKGKETWNKWVKKHPSAIIKLGNPYNSEFEWDKYKDKWKGEEIEWPFAGYNFPRGEIHISGIFGYRTVSFENSKFSNSEIYLVNCLLPKGVLFNETSLNKSRLSIIYSKIQNADMYFSFNESEDSTLRIDSSELVNVKLKGFITTFEELEFTNNSIKNTYLDFRNAKYCGNVLNISRNTFENSRVNFSFVELELDYFLFKDNYISKSSQTTKYEPATLFYGTQFLAKIVSFYGTDFGNCLVDFMWSHFRYPYKSQINQTPYVQIDFSRINYQTNEFNFSYVTLCKSLVSFNNIEFGRKANFSNLTNAHLVEVFSFEGSVFNAPLHISFFPPYSEGFTCLINFTNTTFNYAHDLTNVFNCYEKYSRSITGIQNPNVSSILRLKQLAKKEGNEKIALVLYSMEMRAKRTALFSKHYKFRRATLDAFFAFFSNYGQSIIRPLLGLLACLLSYPIIYALTSTSSYKLIDKLIIASDVSLFNSFPFFSSTRGLKDAAVKKLYGQFPPDWLTAVNVSEGLLAFVFIFLIGLGLRNRFRI